MTTALIVADLEGIGGVDRIQDLVFGAPGYAAARARMTAEVVEVAHGLRVRGFDRVRISDSHRSGSGAPNLIARELPPFTELIFEDDAFSQDVLQGSALLACVGMHAAAGTQGFAAHTLHVHCALSHRGRAISESDLLLALAAEAGLAALFVSGDDVLAASLDPALALITKTARSRSRSVSLQPQEISARFRSALSVDPRQLELQRWDLIEVRFKSVWQAEIAESVGAKRIADRAVEVRGDTVRALYDQLLHVVYESGAPLGAFEDEPGGLLAAVPALMSADFEPVAPPAVDADTLDAVYAAFLRLTDSSGDEARALRALILHMLAHHAPATFAALDAGPVLATALAALASVPLDFPEDLEPDLALARVDAWYVCRARGGVTEPLPRSPLERYTDGLVRSGDELYAWLIAELARLGGVRLRARVDARPYRETSRLHDLYWITHLILLDTHYAARPLITTARATEIEVLRLAVPWLVSEAHVDLAAEVALCLQLAGEVDSAAHQALVEVVLGAEDSSGAIVDHSMDATSAEMADHATGVTLLMLAGMKERSAR